MTKSHLRSAAFASGLLSLAAATAHASNVDEVIKAFEKKGGYVQPLATLYGSLTNSGWYQSAAVPRGFSFYLGLPVSLVQIADDDRSYKGSETDDGCVLYHKDPQGPAGTSCPEKVGFTGPTIFGSGKGPSVQTHNYDPIDHKFLAQTTVPENDGNKFMASFNWLPFTEPQLGLSYFNTEVKLRYFALPLSVVSVSMPGFGLQHDFAWAMPNSPVHVSAGANWTFLSGEWKPGGHVDGKLKLDGASANYNVLAGWTWKGWLELFTELGWETSSIETGGHLTIHDKDTGDQEVKPNLTLDGNNGFRLALNVAFHLGYDAVLGQNIGADLGNQLGLLAYRFKR